MPHNHVRIAVDSSATRGVELVPAQSSGAQTWMLLRSPLYALQLAAGDTIRITDSGTGAFEILSRGRNVAVHFYLHEDNFDNLRATEDLAGKITPKIAKLGGRLDGQTSGLMVFTVPVDAGFSAIEAVFAKAVAESPGAQWEYTNVYDASTGEPLRWWE